MLRIPWLKKQHRSGRIKERDQATAIGQDWEDFFPEGNQDSSPRCWKPQYTGKNGKIIQPQKNARSWKPLCFHRFETLLSLSDIPGWQSEHEYETHPQQAAHLKKPVCPKGPKTLLSHPEEPGQQEGTDRGISPYPIPNERHWATGLGKPTSSPFRHTRRPRRTR